MGQLVCEDEAGPRAVYVPPPVVLLSTFCRQVNCPGFFDTIRRSLQIPGTAFGVAEQSIAETGNTIIRHSIAGPVSLMNKCKRSRGIIVFAGER